MRLKLPHISRFISATIFLGAIIALFSFNFSIRQAPPQVLLSPFSWALHKSLAQELWQTGFHARAKQELQLANELSGQTNVLGAMTESGQIDSKIVTWQNIAASHPDYRDAYIQLASLSYAQGNWTQTKNYLEKAQSLDPNGKSVSTLLEFMNKKLE